MDRIFEAAREQRARRSKLEEGVEKDITQIKAVYAAKKLGLPFRIVPTDDWQSGFRYIVVTGRHAAHVVYLTPESEVVSVREVYDDRGTPKSLTFLYRKQDQPEVAKPVDRPPTDELPAYRVLFSVQKLGGGGKFGDVLVPSLSRATAAVEREAFARRIAQREGLTDISIYSTEEAYRANESESYSKQHPGALRKGFLGSITDGQFAPGESLFP